ncbi:alpha-L-rhamnosidase C-terminal domain-containing protein [Butyrivibrio sp.]|uniref:alpha-L-rhamnosidase C-terminal domain-containing protein n=1 Tax=Butyrivibrio sp. TaxID=28121 RepID=UPI003FA40DF2
MTPHVAGFRVADICPQPSMRFRHFNTCMTTAGGRYVSNWKIAEDGMLTLNIEVPFNAKANVNLIIRFQLID